jgi:hypothetical protein
MSLNNHEMSYMCQVWSQISDDFEEDDDHKVDQ